MARPSTALRSSKPTRPSSSGSPPSPPPSRALTHIPDTALGKLCVILLELLIAALCLRLYRPAFPKPSRATLHFLAFIYISAVAVMPARDFGQRDHLLTLLLLPYLCAAALRLQNLPVSIPLATISGILALLGLALKPHQLLIPLALLCHSGLQQKNAQRRHRLLRTLLRPELIALLLSGLVFLAAVHHFSPLYLSTIVPLARDTYWAYGSLTLPQLLAASIQLHILLVLDAALILYLRRTSTLSLTFFIAGLAATLAFYLQGTGWYYQQLPALTFLTFTLALQLLALAQRHPLPVPRRTVPAALALSLLALFLTAHFMNYPFTLARAFPSTQVDPIQPDPTFYAGLPPGAAVLTLSPTVDDTIPPVYQFHLTLGQRYPHFFLLPALLRTESFYAHTGPRPPHLLSAARLAALDRLQQAYMLQDLNRWHPALILVERCQDPAVHCQVLEDRHDDLLAFFLRDPAFAAIFARYHLLRRSGPYDAYIPS